MNTNTIKVKISESTYDITSDDLYLEHIRGGFEPESVELFNSLLRYSDCIIDIGANIGITSILFGEHSRRVYSFEPSPTTFNFLKKILLMQISKM